MEFITQYSESVKLGTSQVFTKPSKTEPDNSMSIPEIIARFTRGQGLAVPSHPWTTGSAPDIDGSPVNDAELEQFMETVPNVEPAQAATAAAQPAPVPSPDPAPVPDSGKVPPTQPAPAQ